MIGQKQISGRPKMKVGRFAAQFVTGAVLVSKRLRLGLSTDEHRRCDGPVVLISQRLFSYHVLLSSFSPPVKKDHHRMVPVIRFLGCL